MRSFLLALGFLTRFAPAMAAGREELGRSCFWFPLAGAVLGLCAALSAWLVSCAANSWAAAWWYVLFLVWATRALHADGLADLADALGSGKTGEAFYAVLKDSRIGTFGTVALILALGGQIIFSESCLESGNIYALAFAPIFGRSLPMLFTAFAPARPGEGLGSILKDAPAVPSRIFCLACVFLAGPLLIGPAALLFSCPPAIFCLIFLVRAARREHGYTGDFLGALILGGELSVLAASSF